MGHNKITTKQCGTLELGHAYEVDVAEESACAAARYKIYLERLVENKLRFKQGKLPLSTTPHQHNVEESRQHGNLKDFTSFKRLRIIKQSDNM